MAGEDIVGTTGMSDAREAFQSAMDSETPSRSKGAKPEREKPANVDFGELFPQREMDRREREGALDEGDPQLVKQARDAARQRGEKVLGETRTPIEGSDADDDDEPELPLGEDEDDEDDITPDDDEEGDDEGPNNDLDLSAIVEVTIDGQPAQISLEEAVRGYIRTETFHKRLGELQQGVQGLQQARTELDGHRQSLLERAEALEAYATAFMPQEPDWDAVYAQDPTEGAKLERKWRTFQGQLAALREQREATQVELQQNQMRNVHQFAQANRVKMMQAHPEWTNEKVWARDHDSMRRTARAEGYSDEEINQLYDARGVNVLLKASKWDRMMATKPKPVKNGFGTPAKTNGATPRKNRDVSRSFDRAEKRLSRVGTVEAAAGVFERILDHEK